MIYKKKKNFWEKLTGKIVDITWKSMATFFFIIDKVSTIIVAREIKINCLKSFRWLRGKKRNLIVNPSKIILSYFVCHEEEGI